MYLKAYANHLPWVQVMATISLQCNGLSQIHSSIYFRVKIVWQVEHTWEKCWYNWRNEWVIWQTSECTKRVKLPGFTQAPETPESPRKRCAWKKEKNDGHLKYFWWKEGVYKAHVENLCNGYRTTPAQQFLIHWRYYLFSKRVNRCQGDGFLSVGAWTDTIKLAMAGT